MKYFALTIIILNACIPFAESSNQFTVKWKSSKVFINNDLSERYPHNIYVYCEIEIENKTEETLYFSLEQETGYPDKSVCVWFEDEKICFINHSGNPRYAIIDSNSKEKIILRSDIGYLVDDYPTENIINALEKGNLYYDFTTKGYIDDIIKINDNNYIVNIDIKKSEDYNVQILEKIL